MPQIKTQRFQRTHHSGLVLIAYGYIAIAQIAQGQKEAHKTYDAVIKAFEDMKELSEDAKADAEIGLVQLQFVHSKI